MSAEGRHRVVGALLIGLVFALSACGDGSSSGEERLDLPDAGASSGAATSEADADERERTDPGVPEVTPAPELGDDVPEDSGAWALELPSDKGDKAAGKALVDYLALRGEAFRTGEVDLGRLSSIAMGDALTDVQGILAALKQKDRHTVGHVWVLVEDQDVEVKGSRAQLNGVCLRNGSVDVDKKNVAQESPPDAYTVDAVANKVAKDAWLIQSVTFAEVGAC